jgi:hypothetical protein
LWVKLNADAGSNFHAGQHRDWPVLISFDMLVEPLPHSGFICSLPNNRLQRFTVPLLKERITKAGTHASAQFCPRWGTIFEKGRFS